MDTGRSSFRTSPPTARTAALVAALVAPAFVAPAFAPGAAARAQQPAEPNAAAARANRVRVTGRVVDRESKAPIANATVLLAGTSYGVSTGPDGRYVIPSAPAGVFNVEARRVGFGLARRDNVRLSANTVVTLDFELTSNPLRLNEVVVSATVDAQQAVKLPFSTAKVTAEQIPVPPNMSAAGAIQGKVAGANIGRARGPGAGVFVQLRTPTSQFNSTSPLYIVDGVILASQIGGTTVDIDNLDIASVEVIQGAAGASLYGSRGANGVVLITTNRGRGIALGTTRFTARSEFGGNQVFRDLPRQQSHQYLVNAAGEYVNAQGQVVPRTQRQLDPNGIMDNPYVVPLYDAADAVFRTGRFLTNNLTVEQNTASTNFAAAFSQYGEQGVLRSNNGFGRQNLRLNLDHRVRDQFQLGLGGSYVRQRSVPWATDSWSRTVVSYSDIYRFNPDVDLTRRNADGSVVVIPDSTDVQRVNPFYRQQFFDNEERGDRALLSGNARYTPRNWLSLDANVSYDRAGREASGYTPAGVPNALGIDQPALGSYRRLNTINGTYNAVLGATVSREYRGLASRLTVRGWTERESYDQVNAQGDQLTVTVGNVRNLNASAVQSVTSSESERRSDRVQGALNLDYRGKIVADFALTRDGSSLFGAERRWNNFYRAGAVYRISEERWFPLKETFDNLGLRFTSGQAGTRPAFSDQYEVLGIATGGALSRQSLGNRFLRPEITTEQEYGVDAVIKNRVSVQLTYAARVTRDNIISFPVPGLTGFNTQQQNVGAIVGRTVEATVQAQLLKRGRFAWDANVVADRPRNRITAFNRSCYTDGILNRCDGTRLNTMWGNILVRRAEDLPAVHAGSRDQFQVNDDGYLVPVGAGNSWTDGLAKSLWGTNVTIDGVTYPWGRPLALRETDGTLAYRQIGDGNPQLNFGVGNTFRYGNVRLYGLVTGQLGGNIYNQARQTMYTTNSHGDLDQSAKPEERRKPVAYYSSATGVARNNVGYVDAFVEDATYAKLGELQLSYTFPSRVPVLSRVGADRLTLELNGRNLFVWSRYSGIDPEARTGALTRIDNLSYPFYRTVTTAVSLSF